MTPAEFRGTYAWKTARRIALQGAVSCALCGCALRPDLPRNDRRYPTVDHLVELGRLDLSSADGRAIATDPANLRVVCRGCNCSRGARFGNALRAGRRQPYDWGSGSAPGGGASRVW